MSAINCDLHVGDVGTVLEMEVVEENSSGDVVPVNIALGSTLQFKFLKPDGVEITKTAVLSTNGSDGKMRYVVEPSFLDKEGIWQWAGYLVLYNWAGHTAKIHFYVNPALF